MNRKDVLVCFSHLRWDFVYQRPQHLLSRATQQYDVYFMEEPIYEPVKTPNLKERRTEENVTVLVPILRDADWPDAIRLQRDMLSKFLRNLPIGTKRVWWYYTPAALAFSDHLGGGIYVYDCMDELSAFSGASSDLRVWERKLLQKADVVFAGGRSLFEAKRHLHANVYLFPSSVDVKHFASARFHPQGSGHPKLGFFGVIDERMNFELVAQIAALRRDWELEMIGPVAKIEESTLPKAANIKWLGSRPYKELPRHLAGWDVGIMPFALNEATRFISPTKTPEFLAAALPVVSTPIHDVVSPYGELGLVEIATTANDFIASVERLLKRPQQPWLSQVDAFLATMSWDSTWEGVEAIVNALKTARRKTRVSRE